MAVDCLPARRSWTATPEACRLAGLDWAWTGLDWTPAGRRFWMATATRRDETGSIQAWCVHTQHIGAYVEYVCRYLSMWLHTYIQAYATCICVRYRRACTRLHSQRKGRGEKGKGGGKQTTETQGGGKGMHDHGFAQRCCCLVHT